MLGIAGIVAGSQLVCSSNGPFDSPPATAALNGQFVSERAAPGFLHTTSLDASLGQHMEADGAENYEQQHEMMRQDTDISGWVLRGHGTPAKKSVVTISAYPRTQSSCGTS